MTVSKRRLVRGGEIVYVDRGADKAHWDSHWSENELPTSKTRMSSNAREFLRVTTRFLSAGDRILEGGCGNGAIAIALHEAGFRVTALDWAPTTVERLRVRVPRMEVVAGDVRDLKEFDGEQFNGYWSLGVIEHFWSGYAEILSEADRVLKPGGWLFLTFPAMNPLRRAKVWFGVFSAWQTEDEPTGFYQFLLDSRRVVIDIETLGFKVVEVRRRSGPKGFAEEIWVGSGVLSRIFRRFFGTILTRLVGHGVIVVAHKKHSE